MEFSKFSIIPFYYCVLEYEQGIQLHIHLILQVDILLSYEGEHKHRLCPRLSIIYCIIIVQFFCELSN